VQTFEIELQGRNGTFKYKLEIDHEPIRQMCRVQSEKLTFNSQPLYESNLDRTEVELKAQLYRDDHSEGPMVLTDWTRSGLASIQQRQDNTLLTWFKKRMSRIWIFRIDPFVMAARSEKESTSLAFDASNFSSWFRHVLQLNMTLMSDLAPFLRDVLTGFESLTLFPDGEARLLKGKFKVGDPDPSASKSYDCRFDELSDGQRVLVALYTILSSVPLTSAGDDAYTFCLDEPENFVALREIQPWLNALIEKTQSRACQVLLISHHPELINALAVGSGRWFERVAGGPVRVQPISDEQTGLPISELVARGWLHA
jgi:uncharacterized protein YlaN (UPF0358 family)